MSRSGERSEPQARLTSELRRVAFVTLGCGRNEVDSDQVAGSLVAAGYEIVEDPAAADCVLVNTCAFIEPARAESVSTVLEACDLDAKVLVMGCMAERYRDELAEAIPEAAGVIGFGDYPRLAEIVGSVLGDGVAPAPTTLAPHERRALPLLSRSGERSEPQARLTSELSIGRAPDGPPTAAFPVRTEPKGSWAYLRIAGGCDRVCTFCAIPSFRGRFASRPAEEILAEAVWLAGQGVRELVCVSENTTSWGKDLPGGRRGIVDLIKGFERIGAEHGLLRVRLMYLQPAEIIPELLDAMAASPVVAPYYDLSLQHASGPVLSRMARSGDAERFLRLIADIRRRDPSAVFRSSFIVGFPGETEADVALLADFLEEAGLDWTGFFTFSVEEGTASATMPDQVPPDEARARRDALLEIAETVAEERAAGFVGRVVDVLIEDYENGEAIGRSYREAPETDGEVRLPGDGVPVGRHLPVRILATDGVDLIGGPARVTATVATTSTTPARATAGG